MYYSILTIKHTYTLLMTKDEHEQEFTHLPSSHAPII